MIATLHLRQSISNVLCVSYLYCLRYSLCSSSWCVNFYHLVYMICLEDRAGVQRIITKLCRLNAAFVNTGIVKLAIYTFLIVQ